jgi:TorA maturation chaperone TorD
VTVAASSPTARSALYRLLSLGFAPPSAETLAELAELADALAELPGLPPELADVRGWTRSARVDDLAGAYQWLFGGSVRVAPYEGSYELDPIRQGRQLADVAGFYRAFGAEADGPAAERPDHAGCELEFLSFLELRALTAAEEGDEAGAALVEEIAGQFLRDHAARWLPTFFAQVRNTGAGGAPFYRALAALGERVLVEELARRGLEVAPLPAGRRRLAVEGDSFECGAQGTVAADATAR